MQRNVGLMRSRPEGSVNILVSSPLEASSYKTRTLEASYFFSNPELLALLVTFYDLNLYVCSLATC